MNNVEIQIEIRFESVVRYLTDEIIKGLNFFLGLSIGLVYEFVGVFLCLGK